MSTKRDAPKTPQRPPQRLPPQNAVECSACHHRVYFAVRATKPSSDPRFRIVYLTCPICGAGATLLREVAPTKRRARCVYKA